MTNALAVVDKIAACVQVGVTAILGSFDRSQGAKTAMTNVRPALVAKSSM